MQHILAMFVTNTSPLSIVAGACGLSTGQRASLIQTTMVIAVGVGIFAIFPSIISTVFAQNCVAVVFIVSILLNLMLPKDEK